MDKIIVKIFIIVTVLILTSCGTIQKAGINMISDVMAGDESGELFTGDDDPQLVKDALPFILKMYEILASKSPENSDLLFATGKTFIMYSNVFIQTAAGMMSDDEYKEQYQMLIRSKKMYRRGTEYLLKAFEIKHKGFRDKFDNGLIDEALASMTLDDLDLLYWAASGLMGEFSCDPFDFSLGPNIYKPVAFVYKILELDQSYNKGAAHDLLILVNGSLPSALMFNLASSEPSRTALFVQDYYNGKDLNTGLEKARYHFNQSIEVSGGINAGTYISMATSVSVNEHNYEEFNSLLKKALEIDPNAIPEMKLAGIIYGDKAQWLLDNVENFFLIDSN